MSDVAVFIRRNQMEVTNLADGRTSSGSASFSTERLLVGNLGDAQKLLTDLLKQVISGGMFAARPRLLMQPLEMTEGGLSAVEELLLVDLGLVAGARHVHVHVGAKLSPKAAREALDAGA